MDNLLWTTKRNQQLDGLSKIISVKWCSQWGFGKNSLRLQNTGCGLMEKWLFLKDSSKEVLRPMILTMMRWILPFFKARKNFISILVWYFGKDGFSHNSSGKAALIFDCQTQGFDLLSTWLGRLLSEENLVLLDFLCPTSDYPSQVFVTMPV